MTEDNAAPPACYRPPLIVWVVEYTDDRQSGSQFQAGAFTTQVEAERLMNQLSRNGSSGEILINMIPVHRKLEDWEWDR